MAASKDKAKEVIKGAQTEMAKGSLMSISAISGLPERSRTESVARIEIPSARPLPDRISVAVGTNVTDRTNVVVGTAINDEAF
jgi:hypothetical protein